MEKQYNFNPLSSASDRFAVEEKFMIFKHGQVVKLTYPAHAYDPDPNSTTPTTSLITVTAQKSDTDSASVTEISVPFSVCDRSGSIGADDQDVTQVKSEMMAQENGSGLDPHIARYIKVDSYGTEGLEGKHLITVKYQAAVKGDLGEFKRLIKEINSISNEELNKYGNNSLHYLKDNYTSSKNIEKILERMEL